MVPPRPKATIVTWSGAFNSNTRIVITIANTASINAVTRSFVIISPLHVSSNILNDLNISHFKINIEELKV